MKWNEHRMKRIDFINKKLGKKNEGRAYSSNVDKAMVESYRIFSKWRKPLTPEPKLSDFYHPSEGPKNVELLFVTLGAGLATYILYKS